MRFFRYSLAVIKELIKLLIFFNWAPRNAAWAPNFLFKEGSQKIFLSSSLAKPSIAVSGQPFYISATICVVSGVAASCNIQQLSFFFLSICFLFQVKKIGQI